MGEAELNLEAGADIEETLSETVLEELSVDEEPDLIDVDELLGENMKVDMPEDEPAEEVNLEPEDTFSESAESENGSEEDLLIEEVVDETSEVDALEDAVEVVDIDPQEQQELIDDMLDTTDSEPDLDMEEAVDSIDEDDDEPVIHEETPRSLDEAARFISTENSGDLLDFIEGEIVQRCNTEEGFEYIRQLSLVDLIELRKMVILHQAEYE